ncbi:hypothetical protein AB4Z32_02060 [Massilia sp. 2TAF26]|uniref:hypothetical protein n=1 Tax=Massilia sp. 2TAF26 TaxID=3233012 RepID=UPI003F9712A2
MRPTDEDQSGSRRPNLMSSTRRSANEINILAMLDRHESAGLPQRMLRCLRRMPALFWYGTAGVLVVGLVGTLAWLAGDGGAPSPTAAALAGAGAEGKSAAAVAAPPAPALPAPGRTGAAEPLAETLPAGGATVVEVAPAPVTDAPAPAPVHTLPPQQHAGRIAPRDAQRDPPRLAAHAAAKPAPRTVAARAPAHAETRRGRQAPSAKPAQDAVDTDVALISAIIQHASKRQEAEDAASKP